MSAEEHYRAENGGLKLAVKTLKDQLQAAEARAERYRKALEDIYDNAICICDFCTSRAREALVDKDGGEQPKDAFEKEFEETDFGDAIKEAVLIQPKKRTSK